MAVQISGNDITVPRDGTFSRNVSIAGTLTYEDVTNVDSIGLVTARNGVEVGASPGVAASISVDGNAIFSGITTFGGVVNLSNGISGDGSGLTGVASTDNIRTNTNATFLQNINVSGTVTATSYAGDGSALTGIEVGITTESASISGITTYLNLSKDDHELVLSGTNTISVIGGAQGTSHTLRLQNSGIATVTLDSTYFKFASGATPSLPTASGAISLVSFTVHKAGAVGVNTVLLTGASVSFS